MSRNGLSALPSWLTENETSVLPSFEARRSVTAGKSIGELPTSRNPAVPKVGSRMSANAAPAQQVRANAQSLAALRMDAPGPEMHRIIAESLTIAQMIPTRHAQERHRRHHFRRLVARAIGEVRGEERVGLCHLHLERQHEEEIV